MYMIIYTYDYHFEKLDLTDIHTLLLNLSQ